MQDDQPLAFLLVGHGGDGDLRLAVVGGADELFQLFLDLDVRHHLAADLREAAFAAGDVDEAFVVDEGDVARLYQPSLITSAVFSGWCR